MAPLYSEQALVDLVAEFRRHGAEQEHVEFKSNHVQGEKLGQYLAGLSNAAALAGEPYGYLVFGIEDQSLSVVGTTFDQNGKAKGSEDLIPYLTRGLDPQVHFEFSELEIEGFRVVVTAIEAANHRPVSFMGAKKIRVGSSLKDLSTNYSHERRLWEHFSRKRFEDGVAKDRVSDELVLKLLHYSAYYRLSDQNEPASDNAILDDLANIGAIQRAVGNGWQITNLGAIVLAHDINDFPTVSRKAPRVVSYHGGGRDSRALEQIGAKGYAPAFSGLLKYIEDRLPQEEVYVDGIRTVRSALPFKALRELVANALIHQDLTIGGAGPMVEIFPDRVEITSPGDSLVDPARIIDTAPQSRNESLARQMRHLGICEERGTGWDQVAELVEASGLPAPQIETGDGFMRVTVYMERPFEALSRDEVLRAILFHACLQYSRRKQMTNATLRKRFRISDRNNSKVSKLIKIGLDENVIKIFDESVGLKSRSYVPYFA